MVHQMYMNKSGAPFKSSIAFQKLLKKKRETPAHTLSVYIHQREKESTACIATMTLSNGKCVSLFFLSTIHLGTYISTVNAASKCGTWATEACIGDIDKRYDPDTSSNLINLHPLYGKMGGYWIGTSTTYDGNRDPWLGNDVLPYTAVDHPTFINMTVSGTRFYQHDIQVYSAVSTPNFCTSQLFEQEDGEKGDDGDHHGEEQVLDDGICGVHGYATAAEIFRTSSHELNEISVTIGGTGGQCEFGECKGFGQPLEGSVFYTSEFKVEEEEEEGEHHSEDEDESEEGEHHDEDEDESEEGEHHDEDEGHGEHDDQTHTFMFSEDFNSFRMEKTVYRHTAGGILVLAEVRANYVRVSESAYMEGIEEAMIAHNVTQTTQDGLLSALPLGAGLCLSEPCPTEKDWATADPALTESPYQEQYQVKSGVVAGFALLGAVLLVAGVVVYYQWRIRKIKESAKAKFASRIKQSTESLLNGGGGNGNNNGSGVSPKDLIDTFNRIDCGEDDGDDGLVSKTELWTYLTSDEKDLVKNENNKMTEKEFNVLFDNIDKDGSGEIDFTEFCAFIAEVNRSS